MIREINHDIFFLQQPSQRATAQDKPQGEGGNKRQRNIVAHGVVAQTAREPARIAGIAHDKINPGQRLMQTVEPLPEAGQHAGPHKAAQILLAAHAFHGNKGQNKTLVDARARMQHRYPDVF